MSDKREASDKRDLYSQMDKAAVRTAADIEQKYNIGKSFAEVTGMAEDARANAETAQKTAESVDSKLDQVEIFRRLTNDGKIQGMRQVGNKYYFSGECIEALEALFAKNIVMSGKFTHTVEAFLEPGEQELEIIRQHLLGTFPLSEGLIPLFDFNNDGVVDAIDLTLCHKAYMGIKPLSTELDSLADWSGAKKTPVTMTIDLSHPDKAITFSGKNMWGREISEYVGVNFTSIRNKAEADYIIERGSNGIWTYEKWSSGKAVCWVRRYEGEIAFSYPGGASYYAPLTYHFPSGLFTTDPDFADIKSVSGGGLITHSINALTRYSVSWYAVNTTNTTQALELMVYVIGKWM